MDVIRKFWRHQFNYNWKFGLFLILLFGIPRFIVVLQSNVSGGYAPPAVMFFMMWFTPLIFMTRKGRKEIGFKAPRYFNLLYAFILGVLSCAVIFGLFILLFDKSIGNAFVYIGNLGMVADATLSDADRLIYFIIAVIPSMIFSPIGEEFLYRGVIHGSFVEKFGETKASMFDSLAFAITHLAHFGIIYSLGAWSFLPMPALLWVVSMFAVSQLFFRCKVMCDSIYGAVVAHSGFNFAMMYFIFYHLETV